jgi:hypothetical protein
MKRWRAMAEIGVPVFWVGLVIGLSFIETPLKFQAPGITRELGLGIGRLVFGMLGRIEHVLLAIVVALWFRSSLSGVRACLAGLVFIVGLQGTWLLPVLDLRAARMIAGSVPPASYHHLLFIVLELVKVGVLLGLAAQHTLFSKPEPASVTHPPSVRGWLPGGRTERHVRH